MVADAWGFAQDPDTDLGEPLFKDPDEGKHGDDDGSSARGFLTGGPGHGLVSRPMLLMGITTLVVWLGLSIAIALPGQQGAGISPDWRLGLVLAAVSLGGGVDISTHHWALTVSSGPLLPGVVVLGGWVIGWALIFSQQTRRSGVPLRPAQIGQSAGLGLGLFLLVALASKIIGSLIIVNGQQVWVSPSIAGMVFAALTLPVASVATGVWFLGWIPDALAPVLRKTLLWLAVLGGVTGVIIFGVALSYGANPVALVLLAPVIWATGIGLGSGAPVLVQLAEGTNFVHASWGLGGVSGTLPLALTLPVAACSFLLTALICVMGVREAILATGKRHLGFGVIGLATVVMLVALSSSHLAVVNQIPGTNPPPIVEWVATALHNGMAVPAGSVWSLSASVSWPIAIATLFGLFGVAAGIGVVLAGKPSEPWSGQELETSLRKVYKAGLIDQIAFDRGMYALTQAKKAGRKRRRQPKA